MQNFGSVCKGLIITLGLPLGGYLGGRLELFGLVELLIILLLVFVLLPVPLLYAARYLSSRGRPGDRETAAGVRIGLVIIALIFVWFLYEASQVSHPF